MRKYLLIAAVVILSSFNTATTKDYVAVVSAARSGAGKLISQIPAGSESQFGFTNRDEFNHILIGQPLHVVTLNMDFFSSPTLMQGATYITESNEWRVPLEVDGKSRVLVTVNSKDGAYEASDLGGAGLAQELQTAVKAYGENGHCYLFRVYQLHADFLVTTQDDVLAGAKYIPLTSAMMAIPSLKNTAYKTADILNIIKKELINHPQN